MCAINMVTQPTSIYRTIPSFDVTSIMKQSLS
jgi:hypothetical protein